MISYHWMAINDSDQEIASPKAYDRIYMDTVDGKIYLKKIDGKKIDITSLYATLDEQ